MLTFELINPSDAYTLQAESFNIAATATLIVGEGRYGLSQIEGDLHMPIMIFGPDEKWAQDNFGKNLEALMKDTLKESPEAVAQCLESFFIGSNSDREMHDAALTLITTDEDKQKFRDLYHDKKRSSMNNIGARAYHIAQNIRKSKVTN